MRSALAGLSSLLACSLIFVTPHVSDAQTLAQSKAASPAYLSDPRFAAALDEGKKLAAHNDLKFAQDAFRKANKIAGGQCLQCLLQLYQLQIKTSDFKAASRSAADLVTLAKDPPEKSNAGTLEGQALLAQGGEKPKTPQLQAADTALKTAIADNPHNATALFVDGKVLTYLGQLEAARHQFQQCLACESPTDAAYLRVKRFSEDPASSIAKRAPSFTVAALDGSKFNLDAMGGRVVLIDFWATWCGPCNEELPHMKKIAKEFAGQPLVIISVSWDDDDAKWKQFVARNGMDWVQYRDANHQLARMFGINAIPHYFTIDSDGVLTSEMLGEGSNVEGKLKKLIARAKLAQATAAASNPPSVPAS